MTNVSPDLNFLLPTFIAEIPRSTYLIWFSSIMFFLATLLVTINYFFQNRTKLTEGFFAYLLSMTVFHLFLGYGLWVGEPFYFYISFLSVIVGSVYLARIPLSYLFPKAEKYLFYLLLAGSLILNAYLFIAQPNLDFTLKLLFWYMITISGMSGYFIIYLGFRAITKADRIRKIAGGISVILCCSIADALAIGVFQGVALLSEILMEISPILLLWSFYASSKAEENG